MGSKAAKVVGHVLHPENRKRMAQRLNARRQELGWSVRDLASRAELSSAAVGTYLSEEDPTYPRSDNLVRLAGALGFSPNEILDWPETQDEIDIVAPKPARYDLDKLEAERLARLLGPSIASEPGPQALEAAKTVLADGGGS